MNLPPKNRGEPPPGYDDQTVIPKERLKLLTAEFEKELRKIEDYLKSELPGQFKSEQSLKLHLNSMNYAAKELGDVFLQQVEEITRLYHIFEANPRLEKLNELFDHLKKLKHSLSMHN